MPAGPSPRPVHRSGVVLPEDPSDEELARNWTLSESDQREVLLCRGEENRLGLRCSYVCCAGMGDCWNRRNRRPSASLIIWERSLSSCRSCLWGSPSSGHRNRVCRRIRRHLGYVRFHPDLQRELANWVAERTLQGISVEEVTQQAERWLRERYVVLPRAAVFARLLAVQCRRAERGLYALLAQQVPAALLPEIDGLLEVPECIQSLPSVSVERVSS